MFSHHYNNFGSQDIVRNKQQLIKKQNFTGIHTTFFYEIKKETDDDETFLSRTDY